MSWFGDILNFPPKFDRLKEFDSNFLSHLSDPGKSFLAYLFIEIKESLICSDFLIFIVYISFLR